MRQELRRMQRELGITFIHVTHTQLEAIALADVVVVMEKGRIKQAGAAREVYAAPTDRYVAEFLGGQNVLSGRVQMVNGSKMRVAALDESEIEVPLSAGRRVAAGERIDVAVRRDDIELVRPGTPLPADVTALASQVCAVEYQGSFVKVMLDAAGGTEFVAYVPERRFFENPVDVGEVVLATWRVERARLLS
jgi:putative spermidine/putrescine transport system ATP-binding protein